MCVDICSMMLLSRKHDNLDFVATHTKHMNISNHMCVVGNCGCICINVDDKWQRYKQIRTLCTNNFMPEFAIDNVVTMANVCFSRTHIEYRCGHHRKTWYRVQSMTSTHNFQFMWTVGKLVMSLMNWIKCVRMTKRWFVQCNNHIMIVSCTISILQTEHVFITHNFHTHGDNHAFTMHNTTTFRSDMSSTTQPHIVQHMYIIRVVPFNRAGRSIVFRLLLMSTRSHICSTYLCGRCTTQFVTGWHMHGLVWCCDISFAAQNTCARNLCAYVGTAAFGRTFSSRDT